MPRHTVNLSWGPVSYLEWGDADAPVVLLLHGGGFDHASLSWRLLGPELADAGWRVLAPDHPGYGESPRAPWPFTVANGLRYLDAFVDALALDRYVVGGLSLGGALALGHTLDGTRGVRGLVLFDPYGIMARLGGPNLVLHRLSWLLVKTRALDLMAVPTAKNPRLLGSGLDALLANPAQHTPETLAEIAASATVSAWRAFAEFQRDEMLWSGLRSDFTPRLGEITVPTLFVQGAKDEAVPLEAARRASELVPGSRLNVIADAAHWVQRDQPAAVASAVLEFLRQLGG